MRPRIDSARHSITSVLRRGPHTAQQIADALKVSRRTVLRLIDELGPSALAWGSASRRRYALRRALRGQDQDVPLYVVDASGRASDAGSLPLIAPSGSYCDIAKLGWPVDTPSTDGWWEGLPYPLYDMQPQGFLGRLFARREHLALEVSADPRAWSDDDIVWVLSRRGVDQCGNLILGNVALARYQDELMHPAEPVTESRTRLEYARYADDVVSHGLAASSAGGEFPKFTAIRELKNAATPHVIVKFSGRVDAAATQRFADLLICEQLALECARKLDGITVAKCRILQSKGRTFLESERLDRAGRFGRSALVSLHALNGHLLGLSTQDWRAHAQALRGKNLIDAAQADAIVRLWWFGRLIANSDMHLGNLSFVPEQDRLRLSPVYDMLPMAYAPIGGGEVAQTQWRFELPLPAESALWTSACQAAMELWRCASSDRRISNDFRVICARNLESLERIFERTG